MLLRISHTTRFEYQMPAYDSHNEVRMRPLEGANQRCVEFDLDLTPDTSTFEYDDYYGNRVYGFSIHDQHPVLVVVGEFSRRAHHRSAAAFDSDAVRRVLA